MKNDICGGQCQVDGTYDLKNSEWFILLFIMSSKFYPSSFYYLVILLLGWTQILFPLGYIIHLSKLFTLNYYVLDQKQFSFDPCTITMISIVIIQKSGTTDCHRFRENEQMLCIK